MKKVCFIPNLLDLYTKYRIFISYLDRYVSQSLLFVYITIGYQINIDIGNLV